MLCVCLFGMMKVVTASGSLYPELVDMGAVTIFLSLLVHENGDIAADTIELLSELTEADAVENFVRFLQTRWIFPCL